MSRHRTLVIGIGNALRGDDGVGVEIAERLQKIVPPLAADVVDAGSAGVGLLNLLEGYERVLLVDCAKMGLSPGAHRVFHRDEVRSRRGRESMGGHAVDPLQVLDLAERLGRPLDVLFLAVEPGSLEGAFRLSPAVRDAIPGIVTEIRRLTEQGAWDHGSEHETHTHR